MRWKGAIVLFAALGVCAPAGAAHADDFAAVGGISTTTLSTRDADGELSPYASGPGASLLFLFLDSDVTGGFEFETMFLMGDDGERLYDLGISMLISGGIEEETHITPFFKTGLDVAAVSVPWENGEGKDQNVMAGVHGALGVHGVLTGRLVWRAQVGYHGAGVGGLTGQLGLGYIFAVD